MSPTLWNIVLAAGAGRRLASVTGGIPKQFWSADGGPSLLEDTLARSAVLAPPERTVIVVDRSHRRFVHALPDVERVERVTYQPRDRGTAAGVLLGLSDVIAHAPDATVLIMPSDHGVTERVLFVDSIRAAAAEVDAGRAGVVLFGVAPSRPERDYGWITPVGRSTGTGLRPVSAFVEKPDAVTAVGLLEAGAVWNTMILVARAQTLLELYRQQLPELTKVFTASRRLDEPARHAFLQAHYDVLPQADFSRDLIGRAGDLFVHTWPVELGWSDLGTPDRLARWCASRAGADVTEQDRTRASALIPQELQLALWLLAFGFRLVG